MKYKYFYQFLNTLQDKIYMNFEVSSYDLNAAIKEVVELTGYQVFINKKHPKLLTVVVKMNSKWTGQGLPPSRLITYTKVQAVLKALEA